jgi:hypothetical protein
MYKAVSYPNLANPASQQIQNAKQMRIAKIGNRNATVCGQRIGNMGLGKDNDMLQSKLESGYTPIALKREARKRTN